MKFNQFLKITSRENNKTHYFSLSNDWREKRDQLLIYLQDIPALVQEVDQVTSTSYADNPRVQVSDGTWRLRLSSACESSAHCLYAMSEIAAQFANKATQGEFPSSFNKIVKKLNSSWNPHKIQDILKENQWYKRIREMRTEWTHYSTIFIGGEAGNHIIVLKGHRRVSDKVEFKQCNMQIPIADFLSWMQKAISVLDNFSGYLSEKYLLNLFDPNEIITVPKYDTRGFPIILPEGKLDIKKITVREHFLQAGIKFPNK